jgi:hypothetical protein
MTSPWDSPPFPSSRRAALLSTIDGITDWGCIIKTKIPVISVSEVNMTKCCPF